MILCLLNGAIVKFLTFFYYDPLKIQLIHIHEINADDTRINTATVAVGSENLLKQLTYRRQ